MSIIKRPIITEKMTNEGETYNRYGFIVDKKANKIQIKKEIENMYDVTVTRVNTMNYGGGTPKTKFTTRGVTAERIKTYKKAVISLADGDVIDIYSSI
jgi:large subunit ribosomal protein L23